MDKNTLSEYGWIVIVVIILAILIAFAVPFGDFVIASINNNVDNLVQSFGDDQPVAVSEHVHNFNQAVAVNKYLAVPGTCTEKAVYYYSCACGAAGIGTFYGGRDPINHIGAIQTNYSVSDTSQHIATIICKGCSEITNSRFEAHEYASDGICGKCGYSRTLTAPLITIEGDILTITDAQNETEYEIYANGALKATTASQTVDLNLLDFEYGEYDITVKAKADGYNTSAESNSVMYVVAKSVFGLYESSTGYTNQLKSWDELIDEGIVTANGAVVQGKETLLAGNLMLPNTLTELPYNAFADCSSLTGVQFSNSVTRIRDNAFRGCTEIDDVYFNGSLEDWCNIHFDVNGNPCMAGVNLYFSGVLATEIVIPDTVSQIRNYSFMGCTSLTGVEISSNVTKIGNYAFNKCSNVSSVTIEEGLTSVGMLAFSQCTSLKTVNYAGTIDDWCDINFENDGSNPCCGGASLYINGSKLTSVIVTNETAEIKKYAFDGCDSITDVVLSSTVKSVGKSAFRNCIELAEISVNSSVESFGMSAFKNCSKLKIVHFDGTVEQWCKITFGDRNGTPLNAGATLYIGGEAVTEITIPSTITQLNSFAFLGCTSLQKITITENVASIGESAFSECINLDTLNMTATTTMIGQYAFYGCTKLFNVYYGGTLEKWCSIAFSNILANPCRNGANLYFSGTLVEDVVIPASLSAVNDFAFTGCDSVKSAVIENGIISIGSYAFHSCSGLTSITIPASVTSVGTSFFGIDISLKDIYYSGTREQWSKISFASGWDKDAYSYTIHCSDGDIEK